MKVLLILGATFAAFGSAAAQVDEIVVTGSRIARYENEQVPAISMVVRPDFVTDTMTLFNDARDYAERERDLLRTLNTVARAADKTSGIEISAFKVFEDDYDEVTYVVPLPGGNDRIALIEYGGRDDTSRIELLIKTPVDADSTYDGTTNRLNVFVEEITGTGRTKVTNDEAFAVSVRDLQRYRDDLMKAVAADADAVRGIFGDGEIVVGGLNEPVRFVRTDLLDLTLYFPYSLTFTKD